MKNKTVAAWLSFLGGPLGLHRFYLRGMGDWLGWLLPIPTALGVYGIERVRMYGVDDGLSWALIPLLGFTIAGCALTAIVYGLMTPDQLRKAFAGFFRASGSLHRLDVDRHQGVGFAGRQGRRTSFCHGYVRQRDAFTAV